MSRSIVPNLHPEQYRHTRPFATGVERLFGGRSHHGPTMNDLQNLQALLVPAYNKCLEELAFEDRPEGAGVMRRELSLMAHYGGFYALGRQVFHFSDDIVEAFRKTDIEEVPADAMSLPFDSLYIHFGAQADLDLYGNGLLVNGAYVSQLETNTSPVLQIVLTTIPPDGPRGGPWIHDHVANTYYSNFSLEPGMTVVESLESSFRAELAARLKQAQVDPDFYDTPYGRIINRSAKTALEHAAALDNGFPVLRESLRLIVNAICFLTAYPSHITPTWGDEAPPDLVEKLTKAKGRTERRKAETRLRDQGYVLVKMCWMDEEQRAVSRPTPGNGDEASRMRTHWRRGHWRNQPFGKGRKDHRLRWIMPILVNKGDSEPPGHLYVVEKSE